MVVGKKLDAGRIFSPYLPQEKNKEFFKLNSPWPATKTVDPTTDKEKIRIQQPEFRSKEEFG